MTSQSHQSGRVKVKPLIGNDTDEDIFSLKMYFFLYSGARCVLVVQFVYANDNKCFLSSLILMHAKVYSKYDRGLFLLWLKKTKKNTDFI